MKHFSSSEHITWEAIGIRPTLDFSGQRLMHRLQSTIIFSKEAEVQTEPGYVTVAVKEVSKTYEIFVKESLKENIENELESFWEGINKDYNNFRVNIRIWEFSKSFPASLGASLLQSLPWPNGISVFYSKPTSYQEMNS